MYKFNQIYSQHAVNVPLRKSEIRLDECTDENDVRVSLSLVPVALLISDTFASVFPSIQEIDSR